MRMDIQQLSDNAWDIGTVSGVLQGIELTPTLLPNQKEAIASARKAIERISERNRLAVEALAANPHNAAYERPPVTTNNPKFYGTTRNT